MVAYIQVNFPDLRDWKSTRNADNREKILFMADHNASENCLYSTVILSGYFEPLFIHHAGNNLFQSR
jgi:hypothetical protein